MLAMTSTMGRAGQQAADWAREQAAYLFGMYAYAYGFPLVMMDVTRQVMTAARKLPAKRRGEAVRRARQLGLI
jgi:hypothetical protein